MARKQTVKKSSNLCLILPGFGKAFSGRSTMIAGRAVFRGAHHTGLQEWVGVGWTPSSEISCLPEISCLFAHAGHLFSRLGFHGKSQIGPTWPVCEPRRGPKCVWFWNVARFVIGRCQELMRSVMPLPRLSREEARTKVVQTLFDRSKSKASRVNKKKLNQTQIE